MTMRAKQFLEKNFFTRLQTEVWSNLGESNIGTILVLINSGIVIIINTA